MNAIRYIAGAGVLAAAISAFGTLLISSNTESVTTLNRAPVSDGVDGNQQSRLSRDPIAARERAAQAARVTTLEQRLDSTESWASTSLESNVQKEMARLRTEVDSLTRIIEGLESHGIVHTANFSTDESARYSEDELAIITRQEYTSDEAHFEAQDYESQWSVQVMDMLQRRLNDGDGLPEGAPNVITGEILDYMECRAKTCRLELAESAGIEAILEQFMLQSGQLFADITAHYNDTGDAVIFFSNE